MVAFRGRGGASGEKDSWHNVPEIGSDRYTSTITSVQKDNYVLEIEDYPDWEDMEERGQRLGLRTGGGFPRQSAAVLTSDASRR